MANARALVKTYEDYSKMNALSQFDMHQELASIEVFAGVLGRAFEEFQNHPFGSPLIPEWRRIEVALDGILPELATAFDNPKPKTTATSL
jgi:glucosyl-3-phosphoglycerate synthase